MSAVLEQPQVSEGYPVDGRLFEPPQSNRDNERPRYLSMIGSLIDPSTATSRPWTKGGGIEVSNPCLRYVKNFIRKGRITPLLKDTYDFIPYDVAKRTVGDNPFNAGYFPQPVPVGYVPPSLPPAHGEFQGGFGALAVGGPSPYGSLVGRLALPGEQINAILLGSENITHTNVQCGIVEHKSLAGYEYQPEQIGDFYMDREILRIQQAIFPTYPVLPVLLDEIERLLDAAEQHSSLRAIVDDDRESLTLFRDYAHLRIENIHAEMRRTQGKHPYVAIDFVLLAQLGMERQDRQIRATASTGASPRLEEMFAAFLEAQVEEKLALAAMHKAQTIDHSTMAASLIQHDGQPGYSGYSGEVVTNATPAGVETIAAATEFKCPCGQTAKSLAGLKAHQRSCERYLAAGE